MTTFAGGILTDKDGRFLLVRRADHVPHMGGLWSLPGGARHAAESDTDAVVRKLRGETGIEVAIMAAGREIIRREWQGTAFRVRQTGGQLQQRIDHGITECAFFAISDLPERTVLEARIAILDHWLGTGVTVNAKSYSAIVDGLLSALFYSYLEPTLNKLAIANLDVLSWSIVSTPLRKFKSAIPFLLSDMSDAAREYALVAELVFAICTVMDDLCDSKSERYGVPTIHEEFGYPCTVALIFGAIDALRRDLTTRYGSPYAETIADSLLRCSRSQTRRFLDDDIKIGDYFDNCISRNDFLGTAWRAGLVATGSTLEAGFLYDLHRDGIVASQMLNDYYDLSRGDYADFRAGVKSYYTLRLEEEISDRGRLDSLTSNRQAPGALTEFRELIEHHDIPRKIREDVRTALDGMATKIAASPLSDQHRTILTGWNDIPLMNLLSDDEGGADFHARASRFVNDLDFLCRQLS